LGGGGDGKGEKKEGQERVRSKKRRKIQPEGGKSPNIVRDIAEEKGLSASAYE